MKILLILSAFVFCVLMVLTEEFFVSAALTLVAFAGFWSLSKIWAYMRSPSYGSR